MCHTRITNFAWFTTYVFRVVVFFCLLSCCRKTWQQLVTAAKSGLPVAGCHSVHRGALYPVLPWATVHPMHCPRSCHCSQCCHSTQCTVANVTIQPNRSMLALATFWTSKGCWRECVLFVCHIFLCLLYVTLIRPGIVVTFILGKPGLSILDEFSE